MNSRIILAGGNGFLGGALARYFAAKGMEIVILTRNPKPRADSTREVGWDGVSVGAWAGELEGAKALINLAGVSVNCRYHARNCRRLLDSRLESTRALGEAVARCVQPPPVWLNSSTATIYRHNFGRAWDESGEIGGGAETELLIKSRRVVPGRLLVSGFAFKHPQLHPAIEQLNQTQHHPTA